MYLALLLIGVLGYVALLVMGISHGSSHGGGHGHGIDSHVGHAGSMGHGQVHTHGSTSHAHGPVKLVSKFLTLSPLDFFSFCMGAGAVGVIWNHMTYLWLVAALSGLVFAFALIKPLTGFILQWSGKPSEGLESMVSHVAVADANFDALGRGVVQIQLEGQLCRRLARLVPAEVGKAVKRGDQLVVLEVNAREESCVVTTELTQN